MDTMHMTLKIQCASLISNFIHAHYYKGHIKKFL